MKKTILSVIASMLLLSCAINKKNAKQKLAVSTAVVNSDTTRKDTTKKIQKTV
jgi:hypothetical protein